MITLRQCYYNKEGIWSFYYPIYMVKAGTRWQEAANGIGDLKVPEICASKTFEKWFFRDEEDDPAGVENGLEITMYAEYVRVPSQNMDVEWADNDIEWGDNHVLDKPDIHLPENGQSGEQQGSELQEGIQPEEKQEIELLEGKIDKIVEIINNADYGEPIRVDMGGATVVPKEILEAAQGKAIEITLNMEDYSWKIIHGRLAVWILW